MSRERNNSTTEQLAGLQLSGIAAYESIANSPLTPLPSPEPEAPKMERVSSSRSIRRKSSSEDVGEEFGSTSKRRKEQNRNAQRNFRARQTRELKELKEQVEQLQKRCEDANGRLAQQNSTISDLRAENAALHQLSYNAAAIHAAHHGHLSRSPPFDAHLNFMQAYHSPNPSFQAQSPPFGGSPVHQSPVQQPSLYVGTQIPAYPNAYSHSVANSQLSGFQQHAGPSPEYYTGTPATEMTNPLSTGVVIPDAAGQYSSDFALQ